ncbi:MAG: hypothetical protein MK082_06185 [Phycisphaerales bacterium]|nr:hypothetical protein [Phycisphaerales bacterium]
MKRFTICFASACLFGFGLAACEDGAGERGNTIDDSKVIAPPNANEGLSGNE